MYLKRVEILGFKSFADKTVIEFQDGITAILGPNGCGKSNIVDAIKWGLGEQSTREMRTERMEDVIFSGTENRKALSHAEVTLIISDESGTLEFDRPETSVKRRIFREGDSEYFLNGTPVRLKKIRELFSDTGVGKSAYSIMEQGQIAQILSHRPDERRFLLEEAAGITKYIMRGNESERKLRRTEENIAQIQNTIREVRRTHDALKIQAEKTAEYRLLREKAFTLDTHYTLIQWQNIENKRKKQQDQLKTIAGKGREASEKMDNIETALTDEVELLSGLESHLTEIQRSVYGVSLEKENLSILERSIQERKHEAQKLLLEAVPREDSAAVALKNLENLKATKSAELKSQSHAIQEIEGRILSAGQAIELDVNRTCSIVNERQSVEERLSKEDGERENLRKDLRKLTDAIIGELDEHLRESKYDGERRKQLGQQTTDKFRDLEERIKNGSAMLKDTRNLGDRAELLGTLKSIVADLDAIVTDIASLAGLFDSYCSSDGSFLDEFLAPEGIITKKRELDSRIHDSAERSRSLRSRLDDLEKEKDALTGKVQEARENLAGLQIVQTRLTTKTAAIEDSIASLIRESISGEKRLEEIRQQSTTENEKIRHLNHQDENIERQRKEFDRKQKEFSREIAGIENEISQKKKKMAGREKSLKASLEQRNSLEVKKERIRVELEQSDNEERRLLKDFRERYSRELADLRTSTDSIDSDSIDVRDELLRVKSSLKSFGRVNLMAPEEFSQVAERYNFLCTQLKDIEQGKKDLLQITDEICQESTKIFLDTYQRIRESFHEIFRRLFGGGKAELHLVDPNNPLKSGLEIFVQPPGKKLENVSLLSGGEKSLCGVALMFAIFVVKPSPFCILDEIDAALDEANIQRFISILTEFGTTNQFVIITHNKKTVAGAQNLLGVTMQESGISRLISMKLDGYEQERA